MGEHLLRDPVIGIIFFQGVILLIALSNLVLMHNMRRHARPEHFPSVSILVPARNEEANIARCIQSLLAQDYPDFEVLALDDHSTDGTLAILEALARSGPVLKVMRGTSPLEGIPGKNWACTQLADAAGGELLFFTDADTCHQPHSLRSLVTAMIGGQADLLTGYPRQEMGTWLERLLVPFFSWASLCFSPLWLAYRSRLPVLSSAVGQVMLFRREAYLTLGGHGKVGNSLVEDLDLAREAQRLGLRWRVLHLSDLVSCRMYRSGGEAFVGFSRNYFAAFNFHLLPYCFVFAWLGVVFLEPLALLVMLLFHLPVPARPPELIASIGLSILLWMIPGLEIKAPVGSAFLYALIIIANELAAARSLWLSLTGRLTWRDRPLPRPKWRWL